jgi:hypothetical protein
MTKLNETGFADLNWQESTWQRSEYVYCGRNTITASWRDHGSIISTGGMQEIAASVGYWSEFLSANLEVPGSIPGSILFSV